MCIVKEIKNVVLSVLLCLMCSTLCGCAIRLAKTRPFSAEELESYNAPIVFLESNDGRQNFSFQCGNRGKRGNI